MEERGEGGAGCRLGVCLAEGEGTEYGLRLYFHLRRMGGISIKIHLYPQTPRNYFCDLN